MNTREMANRIVSEAAQYRQNGEAELVKKAQEYGNAENVKRSAQNARAEISKLYGPEGGSPEWDETVQQATAKAQTACDAFMEEYKSYQNRRAKSA